MTGLNRNVFNSTCKYGHHPRQNGIDILQQNKILTEVTSTVKKTKIGNGQSSSFSKRNSYLQFIITAFLF